MNLPPRLLTFTTILIATASALSACGGSDSKDATATRAVTPATTGSAVATSSLGIRALDLSAVPDVQALLSSTGGSYVQSSAIYADLTEDGIDDAVVPISSGGTQGDVAFLVLTPDGDDTKTLLKVDPTDGEGGLSVAVTDGQLVMTRPVYAADDPNCCPSALEKTTYVWDGGALKEDAVTTEENPADGGGGVKRTPAPAGAPQ